MEKNLLKNVTNFLKKLESEGKPVFWERRQAGGFNYRIGIPDLYVVTNGIHKEIELKDPKLKQFEYKPEQVLWQNKFKKVNIESIISNDFEEIKTFILKNLKNN